MIEIRFSAEGNLFAKVNLRVYKGSGQDCHLFFGNSSVPNRSDHYTANIY
jgi:hypothetical protein